MKTLKLTQVLLCMNPLVWFLAEGVMGIKPRRSFRVGEYRKRLTIPAEGGSVHIESPQDRFAHSFGRKRTVYAKWYDTNETLREKLHWKSRSLRNARDESTGNISPEDSPANLVNEAARDGKPETNPNVQNNSTPTAKEGSTEDKHSIPTENNRKVTKGHVEANLAIPNKVWDEANVAAGRTGNVNVTEGLGKENDAVTAQQEATEIYIGNSNYSFVAAIHRGDYSKPSFDNVKCSGGVLKQTIVVTSCSCLYDGRWPIPPMPSQYYVTVGHVKFKDISGIPSHRVKNIKLHPSCAKRDDGLWTGDIAMLKVADLILYDRPDHVIQPMKLPNLKMWDASDILINMSSQRRRCRIIGWSAQAPMVDTAIGELIPMDECANPACKKKEPCPLRTKVNGYMVEITPNEPSLLPGALLYCSNHVFAVVNTKRRCKRNNVFATCSPEELLYTKFDFTPKGPALKEIYEYNGRFQNESEGWETYTYPNPSTAISPKGKEFSSAAAIFFPFYLNQPASWIFMHVLAGYYF